MISVHSRACQADAVTDARVSTFHHSMYLPYQQITLCFQALLLANKRRRLLVHGSKNILVSYIYPLVLLPIVLEYREKKIHTREKTHFGAEFTSPLRAIIPARFLSGAVHPHQLRVSRLVHGFILTRPDKQNKHTAPYTVQHFLLSCLLFLTSMA